VVSIFYFVSLFFIVKPEVAGFFFVGLLVKSTKPPQKRDGALVCILYAYYDSRQWTG
jgi:hypothetical protein